jgi:predicted nuclease with TOPRIM domain
MTDTPLTLEEIDRLEAYLCPILSDNSKQSSLVVRVCAAARASVDQDENLRAAHAKLVEEVERLNAEAHQCWNEYEDVAQALRDENERLKEACDGYLGHAAGLRDENAKLLERIRFADQEFAAECAALKEELAKATWENNRKLTAENKTLRKALKQIANAPVAYFSDLRQGGEVMPLPEGPRYDRHNEEIAALRAENERLKDIGDNFLLARAENERLKELRGTENVLAEGHIARLHAENERLRESEQTKIDEIERLREALARIMEQPNKASCIAVARAALSKGE